MTGVWCISGSGGAKLPMLQKMGGYNVKISIELFVSNKLATKVLNRKCSLKFEVK